MRCPRRAGRPPRPLAGELSAAYLPGGLSTSLLSPQTAAGLGARRRTDRSYQPSRSAIDAVLAGPAQSRTRISSSGVLHGFRGTVGPPETVPPDRPHRPPSSERRGPSISLTATVGTVGTVFWTGGARPGGVGGNAPASRPSCSEVKRGVAPATSRSGRLPNRQGRHFSTAARGSSTPCPHVISCYRVRD